MFNDPFKGMVREFESSLQRAKIVEIEKETVDGKERLTGRCTIRYLDVSFGEAIGVEMPFLTVYNQFCFGGFPPVGTSCLVGFGPGREPYIVRYILPGYRELVAAGKIDELEIGEWIFQTWSGTKVKVDKHGSIQMQIKEEFGKSEPALEIGIGKIRDSRNKVIQNAETKKEVICRIKSKEGVVLDIDSSGNVVMSGLKKMVKELMEGILRADELAISCSSKAKIETPNMQLDVGALKVGLGTGGVHSAVNHPVCFLTGAALTGSPTVKMED